MASVFETLNGINVNEHTEKKKVGSDKNGKPIELTYLSWPYAWAETVKRYPDANYEIVKNPQGLPYFSDPQGGIMVYTRVTIEGVTREMWLPVMDGANNAMKFEPYEIQTKWGPKTVAAATMFDINKTIMRCLVKNLAMFGLGLYIYAGEDLPEGESEPASTPAKPAPEPVKPAPAEKTGKHPNITEIETFCKTAGIQASEMARYRKEAIEKGAAQNKRWDEYSPQEIKALETFAMRCKDAGNVA